MFPSSGVPGDDDAATTKAPMFLARTERRRMPRDASPSTAARVVHARSPHADKANTVIVVSYTPYTTPTIAMCSKSTTTTTTTTARRVHGWLNGALHYDHDHDHPTRPRMVKRCPTLRRHRRITASPTDRSTDHEITIDRSIDRSRPVTDPSCAKMWLSCVRLSRARVIRRIGAMPSFATALPHTSHRPTNDVVPNDHARVLATIDEVRHAMRASRQG